MKTSLSPRQLLGFLAAAVFAALGAATLHAVATDSAAGQLLASELPTGVSLGDASDAQIFTAVGAAVRKDPKLATGIVRVAVLNKVSPRTRQRQSLASSQPSAPGREARNNQRTRDFKDTPDFKDTRDYKGMPCDYVLRVVRAAVEAAPERADAIIEEASRLAPDCVDDLRSLLNDPSLGLGFLDQGGPFGFGFGLGPGFPGSPGFAGGAPGGLTPGTTPNAPGGVVDIPPVGEPVTTVTNG